MNEEKSLKDQFYESDSNWITNEGFERLKNDMEKKFPEIEIDKDEEYILIKSQSGRQLQLHRWYHFDYAPDGHLVEGKRTIEQEIESFVKESK